MIENISNNFIIQSESNVFRYSNDTCQSASQLYSDLSHSIGCTYLIYMYENLKNNEKYVYSSNWDWQNLLIGEALINNCPVFLRAFRYLETRPVGKIFLPWCNAPPSNQLERNVCGIREEHNIANGFGYAVKGYGVRETLAFGGDVKDQSFFKNFIYDQGILFNKTLQTMRNAILTLNNQDKLIFRIITGMQ